jgi:transposase
LASWIGAHVRTFEFYQGVPKLVVPDNTKTGVTKACHYDPDLNPKYQEMAMPYGVGVGSSAAIAALRNRKFFSIEELNQAIRELRDRINQRSFRKREGSKATQFVAVDEPALSPLPAERFDLSEWSRARVNIDYHIVFDTNYYSVPYNLVHELVEVRSTPTTVEIFHKGQRITSHSRAHGHGHTVTINEHPRVPSRRIWNGHPLEWCIGRNLSVRTPRNCSSAFLQITRIPRWATAPVWD